MKIKKMFGCCLVAMSGLIPYSTVIAEELPWDKKLPFESIAIEYEISGLETGKETLYIRDFGKEQVTYSDSTTKIMGMAVQEKSVEFVTPDYIYSYDLQAREGMKTTNPQKHMENAYNELTAEEKKQVLKNSESMGGAFAEGMAGELQEKATKILGYDCDRVDIMNGSGTTYMMHGTSIPLKIEMNMMGMKMITAATSVKVGDVDPKVFEHPAGIQAKVDPESDAMTEAMSRQMMNAMKDPEASKKGVSALHGAAAEENMIEEDKAMIEQAGELLKGMQNIFGN